MTRPLLKWTGFVLLDFILAFLILLGHFLWPKRVIFLNEANANPAWLNVTPGYPDTVPTFTLMSYSPWPLPKQQNFSAITSVTISPDQPVVLKGTPNRARFWSFVLYPKDVEKHSSGLPAIDSTKVMMEPDGSYVLTFSPVRAAKNWVDTGTASEGVLFMRNYVPVPGRQISLPAVYWGDRLMVPAKVYDYEG